VHILFIGDIVGKPGREAVRQLLPAYRRERPLDFVAANAENAAGGSGLAPALAAELFAAGIDCLTMGDHVFRRREILPLLQTEERLIRPANYSARAAGKGVTLLRAATGTIAAGPAAAGTALAGTPVAVINLVGRTFMAPADSPFDAVDRALSLLAGSARVILVDFHAEATSEKVAMGRYLDGRVTAVVGTHTHVPTADEVVLAGGTAYITDVGMTGPHDGIIGRRADRVLEALLTQMPTRFEVATGDVRLNAVLIEADGDSGRASAICRVALRLEGPLAEADAREAGAEEVVGAP
jgi:hypothetical protein